MGVLFGLLAAATYGVADFLGGEASRRFDAFSVVLMSQLIGAAPLVIAIPLLAEGSPTVEALGWGAAAGVAGGIGVLCLYKGLAIGRMSVVAPITGVVAAAIPAIVGIVTGDRPSVVSLAGIILALLAVVLVSSAPPPADERDIELGESISKSWKDSGVPFALAAGISFALFFVFLDAAGTEGAVWPLLGTRGASLVLIGVAVLVLRKPLKPPPGTIVAIGAAGVLDVGANVFYLISTRYGLLSLVAVLTSMYPAVTVLMARIFLEERMIKMQLVGLGLAGAAIAMIVAG
jgi:drug/metabolite transporter (DMT)-like permease